MRKSLSNQGRFDTLPISKVILNLNCRDEIVPIYDKLQDLDEQHRALRQIMGIGGWC